MKTYFLNPTLSGRTPYIREGRCMQKTSSWATPWPPITLGVLAAIAREIGPVRLVDGNVATMSLKELLKDISAIDPDLIVVNTGFPSIEDDMAVAAKIRENFPEAKILAFGVYFTLLGKKALERHPQLDFGIVGEPEEVFRKFLTVLESGSRRYNQVAGLLYKDTSGIEFTVAHPYVENIDQLPFPARDLFQNDHYRLPHNNKVFTLINVARGCPYPCIYCIVPPYYGSRVRKHSVAYVMEEIKECLFRYGIEEFLFWEEVFTLDRKFAFALCEAILKNDLSICWAATTRVGLLDQDLLRIMKRAGCYLLGLGIESGNQEILDGAKKKQTVAEIKKAVQTCKKARIQTMGHFIFGLPGETRETAQKTIDFMLSLGLDYMQSYCAVPYPKTEFGEMAAKHGWIRSNQWSEYDFGGHSIVDNGTITPEEVTRFREKAFRDFYFRPSYFFNHVLKNFPLKQLLKILRFAQWMHPKKQKDREMPHGSQCCHPMSE